MSEPQVWTVLGVFAGLLGAFMTVALVMMRMLSTGLREEMKLNFAVVGERFDRVEATFDARLTAMDAKFEAMDAKFDALDAKIDGLDTRVGRLEAKFDHLERDVTTLFRRDFGDTL